MKKLTVTLLLMGLILVIPFNPSHAAEGKKLFIGKCGNCHKAKGEAPAFAATKYASMQWERFFERNKHKRKKDITALVTAEEIKDIRKYLVDHAADSDQPEAVGLK